MWNAVAALSQYDARDLANYFASLPPKPANDGDNALAAKGKQIFVEEFPRPTSSPAMPVTAQTARASETFLASEGWPISMSRRGCNNGAKVIIRHRARRCRWWRTISDPGNRGPRLLSQLCQIGGNIDPFIHPRIPAPTAANENAITFVRLQLPAPAARYIRAARQNALPRIAEQRILMRRHSRSDSVQS